MHIIFDDKANYGRGERQALAWVGADLRWLKVEVTRRSDRPFDMDVKGKSSGLVPSFTGRFLNSALYVFWKRNLIVAPQDDWSRVLKRDEETNWRVFETAYSEQTLKASMVPMFSNEFMQAMYATWQEISPDAGRCTNAEAIELCLDADRLTTCVGEWADKEFDAAQEQHGYKRAAGELARLVKLV